MTRPGFVGCFICMCEPFLLTLYHPSAFSRRNTSRLSTQRMVHTHTHASNYYFTPCHPSRSGCAVIVSVFLPGGNAGRATGMRVGEARQLEWRDVDGTVLRIRGAITKNGMVRTLPTSGAVAGIVAEARQRRQLSCPNVFRRDGQPIGLFRKAVFDRYNIVSAAALDAGLQTVGAYLANASKARIVEGLSERDSDEVSKSGLAAAACR